MRLIVYLIIELVEMHDTQILEHLSAVSDIGRGVKLWDVWQTHDDTLSHIFALT